MSQKRLYVLERNGPETFNRWSDYDIPKNLPRSYNRCRIDREFLVLLMENSDSAFRVVEATR